MTNKHQFALFDLNLQRRPIKDLELIIDTPDLIHRIISVLRLDVGNSLILFDTQQHFDVELAHTGKKLIRANIIGQNQHTMFEPRVTVWLPLLKRAALEDALYSAVELGANEVRLFDCAKSQASWRGVNEFLRCERIMIAAAEQSKNFALPRLHEPCSFDELVEAVTASTIFFDPAGEPLLDVIQQMRQAKRNDLALIIGPEGDLSDQEKKQLQDKGAVFCALTPTVLRARQAVAVGLGSVRSLMR